MELSVTGEECLVQGHPYPGIPFLVDQGMALVDAPNRYLFHIAVVQGRVASPKSWKTYGDHLYEYFAFLEENGFQWDQVNQTHFAAWRDSMLDRGCKRQTVNQRLRTVSAFYQWAQRQGLTHYVPFAKDDVWVSKPRGFLDHVDASGNRFEANELTLQTHTPLPQFLNTEQAKAFVADLRPKRNRLMAYLMWLSGMRREEVVGLRQESIPNPAGHPNDRALKMGLDPGVMPTKGDKKRWVLVPYHLAVALWDYMVFERPNLDRLHKRRHGTGTDYLFLNRYGEPLSLEGLNNAFRKASHRSGIKCSPHMLRHTYGTYEFLRMSERKGQDGALHWVRDRLGHSSIQTTEKYIHAADLVNHEELDGYQLEVCQFLADEA